MRTRGRLVRWVHARGFGFVETAERGIEVFVHISAFVDGQVPAVGTQLEFAIETDAKGRKRAVNVSELNPRSALSRSVQAAPAPQVRYASAPRRSRPASGRGLVIGALLVSGLGFGIANLNRPDVYPAQAQPVVLTPTHAPARAPAAPQWSCNGINRCPQMRSCEEAQWRLQHCSDQRTDGDGDGVPCEREHCY